MAIYIIYIITTFLYKHINDIILRYSIYPSLASNRDAQPVNPPFSFSDSPPTRGIILLALYIPPSIPVDSEGDNLSAKIKHMRNYSHWQ